MTMPVDGGWHEKHQPESKVPAVIELYQNSTQGDDDDVFLDRLFNKEIRENESLSTKQKAIQDVYFKLMAPYNWDPRTTVDPPFENFSELWKPSTLKKVKNFTMQAREELLATQVSVDAASVIDTNGHVDKTVKTDAQRVLGFKELAGLLRVDKLTPENGFQLPDQLKSQIEAQHPNASAEANGINGDFLPFYDCFMTWHFGTA